VAVARYFWIFFKEASFLRISKAISSIKMVTGSVLSNLMNNFLQNRRCVQFAFFHLEEQTNFKIGQYPKVVLNQVAFGAV
jgi:hypothetical protein